MTTIVDLHMHTNSSDGALLPSELLARCKAIGLLVVSVTDHDTTEAVLPAIEAASALGIKVVPGSELSVEHNGRPLHMLAYNFDPRRGELKDRLARFLEGRRRRAAEMVTKLQGCGFIIELEDVLRAAGGESIGRPHVAQAVMDRTENADLLERAGVHALGDFFERYLEPGRPAHTVREKFPIGEAISLVHQAGGIAVLAHPGWNFRRDQAAMVQVIRHLVGLGLDGIESFYRTHDESTTRCLHGLAAELGICETAGSDFHRPEDELFGALGAWESYGLSPHFPLFVGD
jgi:predicted metal-dependent phosphoesterase TrpH